jgi:hypothetical protein
VAKALKPRSTSLKVNQLLSSLILARTYMHMCVCFVFSLYALHVVSVFFFFFFLGWLGKFWFGHLIM